MNASVTIGHERVQRVVARSRHFCWSWSEYAKAPGDGWDDKPPCTRMIEKGETHVLSTIYPGHDSGYADGGYDRRGNPVPARPVSSRFCLPCAGRWKNLADRLTVLDAQEGRDHDG